MFPPPCLTWGWCSRGYSQHLFLHTRRLELMPKIAILVSSDHITFSQAFSESFRCSLSNFRRPFMFLLEQETFRRCRIWSIMVRCVTNSFLGDCGPSCLEIINKFLPGTDGASYFGQFETRGSWLVRDRPVMKSRPPVWLETAPVINKCNYCVTDRIIVCAK